MSSLIRPAITVLAANIKHTAAHVGATWVHSTHPTGYRLRRLRTLSRQFMKLMYES